MTIASHSFWLRVSSIVLIAWMSAAAGFQQSAAETPEQKLDAILKRFEAQRDAAYAAENAAKSDEARAEARKLRPGKEYVRELRDLAVSVRGTATALSAWISTFEIAPDVGDVEGAKQALETLLTEHLESPRLVEISAGLRYAGSALGAGMVQDALRTMMEGSPHEPVRASALSALGGIALGDGGTNAAQLGEAKKLFARLAADYGDLPAERGKTYRAIAEDNLFEIDHLQVGMVAPDFEAVDENGVKFKLSDYRGKVVIVDFWGFW